MQTKNEKAPAQENLLSTENNINGFVRDQQQEDSKPKSMNKYWLNSQIVNAYLVQPAVLVASLDSRLEIGGLERRTVLCKPPSSSAQRSGAFQ